MKVNIPALTSLRGLLAMCIVVFHFGVHAFDPWAYLGVTFFFMVSGFLTALRHSEITSAGRFVARRLFKIYALHWLALGLMIALDLVVMHQFSYGKSLAAHVLLLQSWFPVESIYYGYNPHAWFLSAMVLCVAVTPWLVKVVNRRSLRAVWAVLGLACAVIVALDLLCDVAVRNFLHVFPPARLADYTVGIALGVSLKRYVASRGAPRFTMGRATALECVVFVLLFALALLHATGNGTLERMESAAMWWIPLSLVIVVCTLLTGQEGGVGQALTLRPLLWLGGISFEIYILQKFVNNLYCYGLSALAGHFGFYIYDYSLPSCLVIVVIAAWLVHRYYTRPLTRSRFYRSLCEE